MPQHQVFDELTLLVDKSLVVADVAENRTRFRLLDTVRHYAMEKLLESGEADAVRALHRDHYARMAALLDSPDHGDHQRRTERVELEIDNLRAAFAWCRENEEIERALELTSALQPLWLGRGRIQEGLAWFDAVLTDQNARHTDISAVVRGRALADKATLDASRSIHDNLDEAQQAVAIARDIKDQALLARALTACGAISSYSADAARPYLAEAIGIAREIGDQWRLTAILTWQAYGAFIAGDPIAAHEASQEGRELADAIGDQFHARSCNWTPGPGADDERRSAASHYPIPRGYRRRRRRTRRVVPVGQPTRPVQCTRVPRRDPRGRGRGQRVAGGRRRSVGRTTRVSAMRCWPPRRWPRAMSRRRPKRARRPGSA